MSERAPGRVRVEAMPASAARRVLGAGAGDWSRLVAAGLPLNADGTVSLVAVAAWLTAAELISGGR